MRRHRWSFVRQSQFGRRLHQRRAKTGCSTDDDSRFGNRYEFPVSGAYVTVTPSVIGNQTSTDPTGQFAIIPRWMRGLM